MVNGRKYASGTSDIEIESRTKIIRNVSIYTVDEDVDVFCGGSASFPVPAGATFTATDINPTTNIKVTRASATVVYVYWW